MRSLIARFAVAVALPLAALSASLTLVATTAAPAHAQQMPAGAANDADREQGLMYRTSLAPNEGMLFVFNENAVHCFWMKNTLIPLSIAFMRADGTVTDIDEMQAETTNNHCPKNNGVYALEMSKGWFTSKGIKPGMKIQGLPAAQ
jgi:uncharacterized membrane protein (UPF0127 family)